MKKLSITDVAGTLILLTATISIFILFFFYNNGQYIANLVTG